MKTEQKQSFARAEAVAAMAAAYREEQRKLHELTLTAQNAAQRGEAAEYVRADETATLQQERLNAMMKMADALGIETEEFMNAVNQPVT